MKFKSVLFDLDGTLLDTLGSLVYASNLAMEKCGYPLHTREEVRGFINYGSVELIRRALPEEVRHNEDEVMRVHGIYFPILRENATRDCVRYDGLAELCGELTESGVKIAVLTNKPDAAAKACIEKYYPDTHFASVRGMVPGKFVKPERAFTEDMMREIGADPESTLFVGDSHVDVATAHNASLPCAGVCWGFHGDGGFGDTPPDYLIRTPDELKTLILG